MWKYELFNNTLKEVTITRKKTEPEYSLKKLYLELKEIIGYSPETIRHWSKNGSHGPSDEITINKLEEYFGIKFTDEKKHKEDKKSMCNTYSDFMKQNILFCYGEMKDFIDEMKGCAKVPDHIYITLRNTKKAIARKKVGIPLEIYNKIQIFMEEVFDPFVDDLDKVLEPLRLPEFDSVYINGKIQPMSEETKRKSIAIYQAIFAEYYEKLDEFAMK